MAKTILIIEDEEAIQGVVKAFLEDEGYNVVLASDGLEGMEKFREYHPDLILLDLMLPKMNGFSVCEAIRKESQVPIIMLTALDDDASQMKGFDALADDYITKPFSVKELCARVRAVIRRKEYLSPVQDEVLTCGPISVNTAARRCLKNGEPVELTMKEFDLLVMLMRNAGRVLTRDALLDKVWGLEYFGDARTVDVHIRYLRQKIEDEPDNPRLVVTLRGVGYRFASAEDLK